MCVEDGDIDGVDYQVCEHEAVDVEGQLEQQRLVSEGSSGRSRSSLHRAHGSFVRLDGAGEVISKWMVCLAEVDKILHVSIHCLMLTASAF